MSLPAPVRLSVVIPVYRAEATLARALASLPPRPGVELLLGIDDGGDYVAWVSGRADCRLLPTPAPRSGVGPVRNFCLGFARGTHVAFLDADDHYAPGSLDALLAALSSGADLLFPHMAVHTATGRQHLLTGQWQQLTLARVGEGPFSYHSVLRRDWAGPFQDRVAQDVDHAVRALLRQGGSAPLVPGCVYVIERQPAEASISRRSGYSSRIAAAYADYAAQSQDPRVQQLYAARQAFNARYAAQAEGQDFYEFWLSQQQTR